MAPEAIRSAAPAIPYQDRRGSDAPLMLPTNVITWLPPSGFNTACNKMVSAASRRRRPDGAARRGVSPASRLAASPGPRTGEAARPQPVTGNVVPTGVGTGAV